MYPKLKLHGAAQFWWVFLNIITLGLPYFRKLTLEKAMIDVLNMQAQLAQNAQVAAWQQSQQPEPGPGYIP